MSTVGFLAAQAPDAEAQRIFDDDLAELGYVMNVSKLWAYQPATLTHLFDLMGETYATERLSESRSRRSTTRSVLGPTPRCGRRHLKQFWMLLTTAAPSTIRRATQAPPMGTGCRR